MTVFLHSVLIMTSWLIGQDPDTTLKNLPVYEMEEIPVVADRDARLSVSYSAGLVTMVPDSVMKSRPRWSDLVSLLPGGMMKEFGGSAGVQTLTSRGTTSSQNVVVLDGMVLNDGLTGTTNLGLVQPSQLSRLTFRSGGYSSDVAAGGLGSTLYLGSRSERKPSIRLETSYGSWNTLTTTASLSGQSGSWFGSGVISRSSSDGNFDFIRPGETVTSQREWNAGRQISGLVTGGYESGDLTLQSVFMVTTQHQQVPGAVATGNPNNDGAVMDQSDVRWIPSFSGLLNGNRYRMSGLVRSTQTKYDDPDAPSGPVDWSDREQALRLDWIPEGSNWPAVGLYLRNQKGNADVWLGKPTVFRQDRQSLALFSGWDGEWIRIQGRLETSSDYSPLMTGAVAGVIRHENWYATLSLIRNARFPSFTEIQFRKTGETLFPEQYTGFEPELRFTGRWLSATTRGFWYRIDHKIIGIPQTPVRWSAINAGSVIGTGIEQTVTAQTDWVEWWGQFIWQRVTLTDQKNRVLNGKQVVYTPFLQGATGFTSAMGSWQLGTDLSFTGERYWGSLNLPDERLYAVALWNATIAYQSGILTTPIHLTFKVQNITGYRYEWVRSYPMPGRSIILEATCDFL